MRLARTVNALLRPWAAAAVLAGWLAGCGDGGQPDQAAPSSPPSVRTTAASATAGPAAAPAATLRVHYQRQDAAYAGWAVYAWEGPLVPSSGWPGEPRFFFDQADAWGAYADVALDLARTQFSFLLNRATSSTSADKDCPVDYAPVPFAADVATQGQEVWVRSGDCTVYPTQEAADAISIAHARAHWLDRATIAWPNAPQHGEVRLYHAAEGGIQLGADRIDGADGFFTLTRNAAGLGPLAARYPHLAGAAAFVVPPAAQARLRSLLKGQLVLVHVAGSRFAGGTQLQQQGVIDDLYARAAQRQDLGLGFRRDGRPVFRLWAPTARSVTLNVAGSGRYDMQEDRQSGVWSHTGRANWTNQAYYTYTVEVFSRTDGARVQAYTTTDPYAATVNAGGPGLAQAAMVADLGSPAFKPRHWDGHRVPALAGPEDIVLYELHVRDFSANDPGVSAARRGKYLAFAEPASHGMRHLRALAGAGLTHVHLLPTYDIASIPEQGCVTPVIAPSGPVSELPQATVAAVREADCFNWGYDPRHYAAPEGSYASDAADGRKRVLEFRAMVQALHAAGLRVVLDVVYNHTAGSFLDQIVPGYYYRLDADGHIETSTCCQNTATEFAMMEKLMLDTLATWAGEYRVDGFRFDIMGHIPRQAMLRARARADAAAGRPLFYYGEAWNFGEVANDARFVQARQARLAGTGIASFNDRSRDAIRGGGPFDSGEAMVLNQGFASGLCYEPNERVGSACSPAQRADLHHRQNLVRIGMAGNLADFVLDGRPASSYDYGGQPAGYTGSPLETINYSGVHDGETLWDVSQYKHPTGLPAAERARAQVLALGTHLVGQGIPFLHAGDELLRSKSMERDSYNAGDWFNRIDWTAGTNYWGEMGLPSAEKNLDNWGLIGSYLSNPAPRPAAADIAAARDAVQDLLRVRSSLSLLRLRSAAQVNDCVRFPDEAVQQDGLVVMRVACPGHRYRSAVVLVNANPAPQQFAVAAAAGAAMQLHPVLATGSDERVKQARFSSASGSFSVPGRTVAVFVEP
jgi:pullulanase